MVLTRAGANGLAEIAMLRKKALIIPLGGSTSRGDQYENAKYYSRKIGWSVLSGEISRESFIQNIYHAFNNNINSDFKYINGDREISKIIIEL